MIDEAQRRFLFWRSYKRYLIFHTIMVIIYMAAVEIFLWIWFSCVYDLVKKDGNTALLLIAITVLSIEIAIMFPQSLRYVKEIVTLYMGKMKCVTGLIKSKNGRIYEIEWMQTRNVRNKKAKKERGTTKYRTETKYTTQYYTIDRCARESRFEVGDRITILYPTTSILECGGFAGKPYIQRYRNAVYAFEGEPPLDIFAVNRRFTETQYKIAFELFVLFAAFVLVRIFYCILLALA